MPENKKMSDSLPRRSIKNIKVNGTEERYKPTKHYVFIVQVTYTDDTEYVIYRRYSEFFDFHTTLLDQFPIEAGDLNEKRIIPYLPGRKWFARDKKKLADERKGDINDYCKNLIGLKDRVSSCALVREFFCARESDLDPPKDAREKPKKSKLLGLLKGPTKQKQEGVLELANSSFFSEDGNLDDISDPLTPESYKAIADYKAMDRAEISLIKNQIVDLLEKNDSGWWLVQVDNKHGYAPATYLESIDHIEEVDDPEPIYGGEPFVTLDAHAAEADDELSFGKGAVVDVLHKHLEGWWVASYNGKVGYLPSSYLRPFNDKHLQPTESVIVRRKQNVRAKHKRKSVLNPRAPKKDLSIYQPMRPGMRAMPDRVQDTRTNPEVEDQEEYTYYDDVENWKPEGVRVRPQNHAAAGHLNDVIKKQQVKKPQVRPSPDEEESYYSNVDDKTDGYDNVSFVRDLPPLPSKANKPGHPPKQSPKPNLPSKKPAIPSKPTQNKQPTKPVLNNDRNTHGINTTFGSAPNLNQGSSSRPMAPIRKQLQQQQNQGTAGFQSELLKKLERQRNNVDKTSESSVAPTPPKRTGKGLRNKTGGENTPPLLPKTRLK